MRSLKASRVIVALALGGMLLTAEGDARAALITVELVGTHFVGIFQSSVDPNDSGFFDVFIDSQRERRFTCRLVLMGADAIPCDGTLSAAGVFEVIARKGVFQVHGKLEAGGLSNASYRLGADHGALLMLQQKNGAPADPSVFGSFSGDFESMTTMIMGDLMLDVSRDSRRADALMMVTENFVDAYQMPTSATFSFDVFASSLPPGPCKEGQACMHPFSLIGLSSMGDPGVFVVQGTIGVGGAMGEYMFFPMGIANPDVMDVGSFDVGRFIGDVTPR